jgi:hypothetical protein
MFTLTIIRNPYIQKAVLVIVKVDDVHRYHRALQGEGERVVERRNIVCNDLFELVVMKKNEREN